MENFEVQKIITKCRLTAEQWGLDDHPDSDAAAGALNEAIVEIFSSNCVDRDEMFKELYKVMKQYKRTGANNKAAFDRADAIFFEMK
jgi:hypothetical protein